MLEELRCCGSHEQHVAAEGVQQASAISTQTVDSFEINHLYQDLRLKQDD